MIQLSGSDNSVKQCMPFEQIVMDLSSILLSETLSKDSLRKGVLLSANAADGDVFRVSSRALRFL